MRVGKFSIDYRLIQNETAAIADAMKNLVVIDARAMLYQNVIEYIAFSADEQFDHVPANEMIPTYELRTGINADGTRTHKWTKQ